MCKQKFVSSLFCELSLLTEMVNFSISCYFFRFNCASFILQDKAFQKMGWLLKLPKVLWYLCGNVLGDLNFQVLVHSSVAIDVKTLREWRCRKLFKGVASHTEQPWGFVYCRGEKMAVTATRSEVIGVTSISTLPLEQKSFSHTGLLLGMGAAKSYQPRLLRRGVKK